MTGLVWYQIKHCGLVKIRYNAHSEWNRLNENLNKGIF